MGVCNLLNIIKNRLRKSKNNDLFRMDNFHELLRGLILELNARFKSFAAPIRNPQNRTLEFYYSIIFRTLLALDGIYVLLTQLRTRPFLRYPYVLIMRTIVMDIILAERAVQKEQEGQAHFKSFMDSIYTEHFNAAYNALGAAEQFYKEDQKFQEIAAVIREQAKSRNPTINAYQRLQTISPLYTLRQVHSNSKEASKPVAILMFEHYDLFSKLVHFGEFSLDFITSQVSDCNSKVGDKTLQYNLEIVLACTIGLMNALGIEIKDDDPIWQYVDEIASAKVCS